MKLFRERAAEASEAEAMLEEDRTCRQIEEVERQPTKGARRRRRKKSSRLNRLRTAGEHSWSGAASRRMKNASRRSVDWRRKRHGESGRSSRRRQGRRKHKRSINDGPRRGRKHKRNSSAGLRRRPEPA